MGNKEKLKDAVRDDNWCPHLYWMARRCHLHKVLKTREKIKQGKVEENGRRKSILGGGNSLSKDSEAGKTYLF